MSDTHSLPFEFTTQSISEWLSQLDCSDVLLNSTELYKVLSTLKKEHKKIDPAALAIIMMRLTPVVVTLSACLQQAIVKHSQTRKVAKISVRILYHVAFLHAFLARKSEQKSDKALHLNYAVQILGLSFQHCALSYENPSAFLWQCLNECYELACNENLLEMPAKNAYADFRTLSTISLALRRILLFCLTNPYGFSQQDILSLFDFCTQHSALVNFVERGMSTNCVFYWNYGVRNNYTPVYVKSETLPASCVLFNVRALIRSEVKGSLTIDNADLLIAKLDHYKHVLEDTKFTLANPYVFVSGFKQVMEFFSKHVREQQIFAINTPRPKDLSFSTLELEMLQAHEMEVSVEHVSSSDIWSHHKETKEESKLKLEPMKLVQTAYDLFFIAETMDVKLVSGDILVCYDSNLKPVVCITRRVESKQQTGGGQASVIELRQGRASLLQQTEGVPKTLIQALLVENEATAELYLLPGDFKTGAVIKFEQIEVVLDRLLELSPKFMQYAVSVRKLSD